MSSASPVKSVVKSLNGICPCGCNHPLQKGRGRCMLSEETFAEAQRVRKEYETIMANSTRRNKAAPELEWCGLSFSATKGGMFSESSTKDILTDCWGKVSAGSVCAIMGPSGAGKSSLLNVLAGRSAAAPGVSVNGKISVAGKVINPVTYRKNIAYVMQDDSLMATATPREALTFSAKMRLPADVTADNIEQKVEKLLEELGIKVCADVMIGGPLIKGISGGQRKRTSVGVELITDPGLLFLDEPTSGLDSHTAFSLVTLLRRVAAGNCTILCTIHQPSSETFYLFDKVIFMKDGRILYQDTVEAIIPYFAKHGYECPPSYNPADFVMALSQTESVEVLEGKGVFMPIHPMIDTSPADTQIDGSQVSFNAARSRDVQFYALFVRELANTRRDTGPLIGRFAVSAFLNMLFGLIFLGAGGRDNADNEDFNTHFGAVAMVLISGMFASAQTVLLSFPFERPMFLREYSTGTYGVIPYFVSKLLIEVPLNFLQCLVIVMVTYWAMDLQGNFFYILMALFGLFMACNSVAVVMGSYVTDVKSGSELVPMLFVPQILFAGFFIRTGEIPVWLRWAQWLCSLKYAVNLVLLTEFNLNNDKCQTSSAARDNCKGALDDNNIVDDEYWISILMLCVIVVACRTLGPLILQQKAKRYY